MTAPAEKRRLFSLAIGRVLGVLRVARGKERGEVAEATGLREADLEAIEEGRAEATAEDVIELLVALQFGVEDLMAVLATTRGRRRDARIELAVHLGQALEFSHRGSRGQPLSALLGVSAVEGLRSGVTWGLLRVLGRFWNQIEV